MFWVLWVKDLGKFEVDPEYPIRITLNQHVPGIRIKVYNSSLVDFSQGLLDFVSSLLCVVRELKHVHTRDVFHQDTIWASLGIKTLRESSIIEFLEVRLPALHLRVNIFNYPIEVKYRSPFTEASGLQSTICAPLIFEKINRAKPWVKFILFIRLELPGLLEITGTLYDFVTYHLEHAVFVLPAGSAQKCSVCLFDDLNKFYIGNVNIGCDIVRRHVGFRLTGFECKLESEGKGRTEGPTSL
jgi:hypothetical protein